MDADKEHQPMNPGMPLADLARGLITISTVSAEEAVELWGIIPEPCRIAGVEPDTIRGILPGDGDFTQ